MAQPCSGCSPVKECDASSTQLSVISGILEGGIQQRLTVTHRTARIALQHRPSRLDGSGSSASGLTFFSHCLERDSSELCGQPCLRLGNKRGIFAILAGLLLELSSSGVNN